MPRKKITAVVENSNNEKPFSIYAFKRHKMTAKLFIYSLIQNGKTILTNNDGQRIEVEVVNYDSSVADKWSLVDKYDAVCWVEKIKVPDVKNGKRIMYTHTKEYLYVKPVGKVMPPVPNEAEVKFDHSINRIASQLKDVGAKLMLEIHTKEIDGVLL